MNPSGTDSPRPEQRKVFDVSRPGRMPAPPNNRSVVTGYKPQANPAVSVDGIAERQSLMDPKQKIDVKPDNNTVEVATQPAALPEQPSAPALEEAAIAAAVPAASLPARPPSAPDPQHTPGPVSSPSAGPDATRAPFQSASYSNAAPPSEDKLLESLSPPEITGHQIVTSHHTSRKSSVWKAAVIILVLLLLAVAALDILLDSGVLEWEIPHTHFM